MEKTMKKNTFTLITALITVVILLTGCGDQGIEGKWVLTKVVHADGTKDDAKDLEKMGSSESYEITGDKAVYTCDAEALAKPVTIEFDLVDLGNNTYSIQMSSGLEFVTATVKGNSMICEVGEGDHFYYSRQK